MLVEVEIVGVEVRVRVSESEGNGFRGWRSKRGSVEKQCVSKGQSSPIGMENLKKIVLGFRASCIFIV